MSYWDGSRWAPEAPAPAKSGGRGRRLLGATAEATLITLLMFGVLAGSTFAARGGGKPSGGSTPTGTCAVTPAPVTVGASYTVTAHDVRPDTVFTVRVSDANGVQIFFLGSDSSGTGSGSTYAYAAGTNSVQVTYSDRRKTVVAASCSFEAV
jgi:hypothetical protein